MLQPGDMVPHFTVTDIRGGDVRYQSIWQQRSLVLAVIPEPLDRTLAGHVSELTSLGAELARLNAACVITRDPVDGVPAPGTLVADRWGEIACVTGTVPPPRELIEWVEHLQHRCPECEGESK